MKRTKYENMLSHIISVSRRSHRDAVMLINPFSGELLDDDKKGVLFYRTPPEKPIEIIISANSLLEMSYPETIKRLLAIIQQVLHDRLNERYKAQCKTEEMMKNG